MRKDFFNALSIIGIYPLSGFDLVDKSTTSGNYTAMYINMLINGNVYGNSFEDIKEQIEEYKNQISKGVIVYEIPFHDINFTLLTEGYDSSYLPGENTTIADYTKIFSRRLLSDDRLEKIIGSVKYIWEVTPELFMKNLNLSEDETYEIDYANEKVIITRTLTPNSFAKEALKVQKSPAGDNIYTYHTIEFESELSLHEIRLQMGYDDSQDND